jgi:hypothetical protein
MKDGAQATLARVVYHTIVKQHVAIAAEKTEKADIAAEEQARAARIAAIPPPAPKPNPFIPPTSVSAAPAMPSPTPSAAPEWDDFPQVEPPPAPLAEKVEQPTTKRIIKLGP